MKTDRRFLLKSMAAAGLAISGIGWAQADTRFAGHRTRAAEVLAVTSSLSPSNLANAFLTGVQDAERGAAHADLQGLSSAAFNQLGGLLTDGEETLLIGLLDDASATLVLDLVRSSGGRILAMESYRVDGAAVAWAQALGESLVTGATSGIASAPAGSEACMAFRCLI